MSTKKKSKFTRYFTPVGSYLSLVALRVPAGL